MLNICIVFFFALCSIVNAASVHGSNTLVLYDERLCTLSDYSSLFNSLEERSYKLDYLSVGNGSVTVELFEGEHRLYNNLVIFPIKGKTLNRQVTVKTLLDFSNDGGDILTITSPEGVPDSVRVFLNQLGIYPSPKDHNLLDNFQATIDVLKVSPRELKNSFIFESSSDEYFLFENASAALLDNREQLIPVLAAPKTSFTSGKGKEAWAAASQGFLVAAFQNLNNARVAWVGSSDFFKDQNQEANSAFIQELLKWTFREKSVIKSTGSFHSHVDGTSYNEVPYKIKDAVKYEVGFSEWNGQKWVPFLANDIQFELKMIDPYYRLTLRPSRKNEEGQFYTTGDFNLPDHHGVFTFQTDYKRPGLSFITISDVKAIRHLAHDEYPRSWEITNARVYLSAIFAVIFAWIIFVIFFVTTSRVSNTVTAHKKNN